MEKRKYWLEDPGQVMADLGTGENGLSAVEAEERLKKYGRNKLKEAPKDSAMKRFLAQLKDPMIVILLVAAFISAVLDVFEGKTPYDTLIIAFVVIVNGILGVVQESKAEAAIEALKKMSESTNRVLRGGETVFVKSSDLVPGDIVLLEAGDAVPADARIIESASMKIEEAALTGESVPVDKTTGALQSADGEIPLGDRTNMAFMGSTVVYGRGRAVITGTGMDTEMGQIADAITQAKSGLTPLQIKLAQLSHILTRVVLGVCIFIFAFDMIRSFVMGQQPGLSNILNFFMIAVSLAVAAIPEGLVAVVTIVLSIGVTNMSKKNAIIRKMSAVETLGCTQIICSDKTGTLTKNKMTVTQVYSPDEKLLATAMGLCNDSQINGDEKTVIGEPTEAALVEYGISAGMPKTELEKEQPRIGEVPFDSGRKMMSTVHDKDGQIIQYTKGGLDEILKKCTHVLTGNGIVPISQGLVDHITAENKKMADQALRVLACAYKTYDEKPEQWTSAALEKDLIFIGLCGMIDPVRPEVEAAIQECREAGITPVMITGDHKDTAVAIAKELGIITDSSQAVTGAELGQMSDEEFRSRITDIRVYARVQPEHKTRIVKTWQELGYVTAMTGDGVNDAPSIKTADIGLGMGITGTDVTKNVADMILADDNFATIVSAVAEGRRVYDNIRKAIQFLLSSNLAEVISVFLASVMGFTILMPTHLLFINLITDCFPALALGVEAPEKNIMGREPRKKDEGILAGGMGFDILYQGAVVTVLTMAAYFIGRSGDTSIGADGFSSLGVTMAFFVMSMCEIFHSFNMRSRRESIFKMGSLNKPLFLAMLASLALTTLIVEVPALASMFQFRAGGLDPEHYMISFGLSILVIPIVEIVKLIQRKNGK